MSGTVALTSSLIDAVGGDPTARAGRFVVRGAVAGVDAKALIDAKIAECKGAGGGIVFLPYIGGYSISQAVMIDASNILVVLGDNVALTATTKSAAFIFTGASRASRISNVGIIADRAVARIDGNARNMTGYTYSTSDTYYSAVLFKWCDNWRAERIYAYNSLVNGIRAYQCGFGEDIDCMASDVYFDNGHSIDFDPVSAWSATDPTTWSRARIVRPLVWSVRAGFGVTSYSATAVEIESPIVWSCGNDDPSYAVSGGGISVEGDYFTPGNDTINRRAKITGGEIVACYNAGLFVTAVGTLAEGMGVYGTIAATNRSNTLTEKGANFYVTGIGSLKADGCKSEKAGTHGVMTLASGFTGTVTTTSGSPAINVTALSGGTVPGGILSGTGIPSFGNPSSASVGGGTTILSGPAGGGTGSYTMSQNATASGSVTVTFCYLPSLDWDGEIISPTSDGVNARGFLSLTTSPNTEIKWTGGLGFNLNCSGGVQYGSNSNFARLAAKRVYQTNDRVARVQYSGRVFSDIRLTETCNLTGSQQSQMRFENSNYVFASDTHNIDTNFKTTSIVYIDTTCANGGVVNISGDTSSAYPKVQNFGTNVVGGNITGQRQTTFTKTADTAVSNTTTATDMLAATAALVTMQANSAFAGRDYEVDLAGIVSTLSSTPGNLTIAIKLGSTTIASAVISPSAGLANAPWTIRAGYTVRSIGASGSVQPFGSITFNGTVYALDNAGTASTIDTTASQALTITAQWATASASNTITAKTGVYRFRE